MKELSKNISNILGVILPFITILAVITPFIFSENLFFPYITGKAFYFRVLVEVMATLYVLYICVDKSVRPRWSPISIAVCVFTLALGLATIFAVDPLKSFWSNYERMEGFILFIHLFAYFFIAGSVMKYKPGWWKWFFISSLVMSVIVGTQALVNFYSNPNHVGYRIFGHLGNSSYLGVYALIHFFIALFFIVRSIANKSLKDILKNGYWVAISFYAIIGIFNIFVLFNTGTRGSFIGLVGGVFIAAVLIALFEKNNKALRITGISLIALSVVFVLFLGLGRNTSVIKNSDMLTRFSELVTFDFKGILSNQGRARSLLWSIAWDGVKERPITGWGLDGFNYIFAKHYNPAMADQEQWFDRSHNVLMDWLTQAGFLGLLSYLSLFAVSLYLLWRKQFKNLVEGHNERNIEQSHDHSLLSNSEKAIITGGFAAYFAHNLFVFDNLSSYVMFFSVLAFLHQYQVYKKVEVVENDKDRYVEIDGMILGSIATVLTIVFVWGLYVWNIRPLLANIALINSMKSQELDKKTGRAVAIAPSKRFASIQKSLAYNSMTNSEQIEQLSDRGAELMGSNVSAEEKLAANKYIIEKYENAIKRTPTDPRPIFFYTLYLGRTNMILEATAAAEKMLSLSPNKPSFLTLVAVNELKLNNNQKFLEYAEKAHQLAPKDEESLTLYRVALIRSGRYEEAEKTATSSALMSKYLTDWGVIGTYVEVKQSARIIDLIKKQIVIDPITLDLRSALASVYIQLGNIQAAIKELEEIKKIAPQYSEQIDKNIEQIKASVKSK